MTLSKLFFRCVNRSYIHTPPSADYAFDRVNNNLTLYFQDSDGIVDWLHNLNFPANAYLREGETVWYAHRGFLTVWESLVPRIYPLVADPHIQRITVAGYSHGAALAIFCHEYVWFHRPDLRDRLDGYGFGCPRVLWGRPGSDLRARWETFTVVRNLDDLVTHLPPRILGYHHVGRMLEIGEAGKYSAVDAHRPENIRRELRAYEARKHNDEKNTGLHKEKKQKALDKREVLCYNTSIKTEDEEE